MRRRDFIAGLGSAGAAWPLVAGAQQAAMPVIGYLDSFPTDASGPFTTAFRQGLSETGYVEGRNVAIEFRSAAGQYERLPALAADLVQRRVAVVAATGVSLSALAAKAATTTIPIVFAIGGDPVKLGIVSSLNRPGGKVTGVSYLTSELGAKRLELFRAMVPNAAKIAVVVNPRNPNAEADLNAIRNVARALGLQLFVFSASTEGEIDAAFTNLVGQGAAALFVASDQFLADRRGQLAALAARHAIPISGSGIAWVAAGALMCYSDDRLKSLRQFGTYTGRILRGEKPSDLPVIQPSKFELVINMKTAKNLGLTIPETLLATAKLIE
jgi:putative tryptophan/tyrosine transport system substrate-binding protein